MLMLLELLAPSVQHGQAAHLGAQMLGVARDVEQALRHAVKQERIEHAGILKDKRIEVVGQGRNHMDVRCRQDFSLSLGEPSGLGRAVTFWATAMPAGVIRRLWVATPVALSEMPAEGRGATQLDGAQGAMLRAAQPVPIAFQKGLAMLAYDIGDFEPRPTHES
jgi:hypothetical protein